MNEGIHLDLDTWIVPDQIRKANLILISNVFSIELSVFL